MVPSSSAAEASSPFFLNFAIVAGNTSSPRASCTQCSMTSLASSESAVSVAESHSPSCALRAPYSDPSSTSLAASIRKCLASSAATRTKSSKNARGMARTCPNRAMMSQLRSMAQLSMCAREWRMATRDSGEPPLPRRGALPGSTRLTRPSLAGLCGGGTCGEFGSYVTTMAPFAQSAWISSVIAALS